MTLVVNRPCGTCAHQAVCRIRDGLEAVLSGAVAPAPPDPALAFDVTVDVSCAHFLAEDRGRHSESDLAALDDIKAAFPTVFEPKAAPVVLSEPAHDIALPPAIDEHRRVEAFRSSARTRATPHPAAPLTVEHLAANGHAPLTPRQSEVMDAIRAAKGVQLAAATALGITSGSLVGMVTRLRESGRLPSDIAALIETHRTQKAPDARLAAMDARDRDIARRVAAHSRERETEASAAHDDFIAVREERARAKANENLRRLRGEIA